MRKEKRKKKERRGNAEEREIKIVYVIHGQLFNDGSLEISTTFNIFILTKHRVLIFLKVHLSYRAVSDNRLHPSPARPPQLPHPGS